MSDVQAPAPPRRQLPLDQRTLDELRRLVREGWVRSLVIRDWTGRELIRMPILVGLGAAALAPIWAALGAVAALATGCTVDVQLEERPELAVWPPEPPPDVDEER